MATLETFVWRHSDHTFAMTTAIYKWGAALICGKHVLGSLWRENDSEKSLKVLSLIILGI